MFTFKYKKLEEKIAHLTTELLTQKIRLDALLKVYPYGANFDGSPRQKPGRKLKVKE